MINFWLNLSHSASESLEVVLALKGWNRAVLEIEMINSWSSLSAGCIRLDWDMRRARYTTQS